MDTKLKIIKQTRKVANKIYYLCLCSCGNLKEVRNDHLAKGSIRSCGCLRLENKANRTHGDSKNPLYGVWRNIRDRCTNPNLSLYKFYGERGIKVCDEWMSSYEKFREWALSTGYHIGLVIDRFNTFGNYEPSNCRWITQKENTRNMRSNRVVTAFDESKCIAEWIDDPRCKTTYAGLYQRIQRGYNP